MIFITAMAIGFATGLLRSAFCVALVAVLIGVAFVASALTSPVFTGYTPLLLAVIGYNTGLINLVLASLVRQSVKSRTA